MMRPCQLQCYKRWACTGWTRSVLPTQTNQLRTFSEHKIEEWRTIPNALTGLRLCAVPGIVAAWYWPNPALAAGLFGAAAITDWFDGYLARRWKQQTSLGALLDPLADKLLVSTTLVLLVENAASPQVTLPAALILARELGVSSLREWAQQHRPQAAGRVSVAWHGKAKAALQMVALQSFLVTLAVQGNTGDGDDTEKEATQRKPDHGTTLYTGSVVLLWLAAALTVTSGAQYARALR
eukprot:symbB.v1.2.032936.t1/scaffold4026.1/size46687/4